LTGSARQDEVPLLFSGVAKGGERKPRWEGFFGGYDKIGRPFGLRPLPLPFWRSDQHQHPHPCDEGGRA
jgi:hypothetical protein